MTIALMRARSLLVLLMMLLAPAGTAGCSVALPDKIALRPEAANVEVINEPPNLEVYESAGEVTAQVIGRETQDALRQALNELRNKASIKGATFISVEDVSSRAAWDFSGRTIVTIVGTAFRTR